MEAAWRGSFKNLCLSVSICGFGPLILRWVSRRSLRSPTGERRLADGGPPDKFAWKGIPSSLGKSHEPRFRSNHQREPNAVPLLGNQVCAAGVFNGPFGHLVVQLDQYPSREWPGHLAEILCSNAVDYSIRPRNPNCIMGGPLVEFHEEHELLRRRSSEWSLQWVPGGDGEVFDPPVKFSVLILEQSYIIAERFKIRAF